MATGEKVKIRQKEFTIRTVKEGTTDYATALLSGLTVTTKADYARDVIARALALQHSAEAER